MFELFPKDKLDYEFIDVLINKLKYFHYYFYDNEKKDIINNLTENMNIIFVNLVLNKYKVNNLTKIIEEKFDSKTIKEIYIKVLSKNNNKVTEYVNDEFSRYFINNLRDLNAEGIYFLIKS